MSENSGNATNFGGADDSTNYLAYPTLMALPRQPEPVRWTAELEAELQRLEAERQRLQARKEELQAQLAQMRSRGSRMADAETINDRCSLDGVTDKNKITGICFLDTLKNAPANAADLSEAKDRSVLCWTKGPIQYIAGEGGVVAGRSCEKLFSGYEKVTAICFDGNFDTSNVTDMSQMFYGCSALTSLNLSGFDTSNLTNMIHMFAFCSALTSLNLSGFDISNVTHMSGMFDFCHALTSLNLSGWDTSSVKRMESMFSDCKSLTDFDPRWLNTDNAVTKNMYTGTRWA